MDHFIICFLICKFEQYLMQVSLFHLFFFHRELHVLCVLSPLDSFSHVRNIFKDFADLARLEKLCLGSRKYTEKQDI